jgi:hypothetical protein
MFALDRLPLITLVLSCFTACASSSEEYESSGPISSASMSLERAEDPVRPDTKPEVVHLYFDNPETFAFTEQHPIVRYTFRAREGGTISVVGDGPAPLNLVLRARDDNDANWRIIATAYSRHNPTLFDTAPTLRSYRLDVTAAGDGEATLALGCETAATKPCAVARQPAEICTDTGRIAALVHCDEGLFCNLVRRTCGQGDQGGRCARIPRECPDDPKPVCACSGQTYANECDAQAASESIWRDGDCRDNPRPWDP